MSTATLWLHEPTASPRDVLLNLAALRLKDGDLALLESADLPEPFIFRVEASEGDPALKPALQISLSQHLAKLLGLSNRDAVRIKPLTRPPASHRATQIEVVCKDAYVGRSEMQRLHMSLLDSCVYVGQRLSLPGASYRVRVAELWCNGAARSSAYVDAATEIVFRSQSASICIFVQISSEAWDFDSDGSLFHEKMADFFLPELFARWQTAATNHVVTLVLFSRIVYQDYEVALLDPSALTTDAQGRTCMDVYKVLLDMQAGCDWKEVRDTLMGQISAWQKAILVDFNPSTDGCSVGKVAAAHEGNVLEALNLACKSFDRRYLVSFLSSRARLANAAFEDRDLMRTGMSVILVTSCASTSNSAARR
jgi:hypothetical protein